MQIHDQPRHNYSNKLIKEEDYWTLERVIQWLEANNFRSAIEMFKAHRIYGRAFLELDSTYLMTLHNELPLSERNKLVYSIKSLLRPKERSYSYNGKRSDSATPLIPERKSSTNEHVLNLVKNIPIPTKLPIGAAAARNNRAFSSNTLRHPDSNVQSWKLSTRPNIIEHQQSIHVTTDSDTFHSLQVTGMRDPCLIKSSILRKLGLGVESGKFMFFHENGKHPNVPLFDNELSTICQNSDHSSTNRILVKPKLGHYTSYCIDGTKYCDFAPKSLEKHKRSDHTPHVNNQTLSCSPQEAMDPSMMRDYIDKHKSKTTLYPTGNLWPVHEDTPWMTQPRAPKKSSLWAVPPKLSKSTSDSLLPEKPASSLWAVPPASTPQFSAENLKLHPSISSKPDDVKHTASDVQIDWAERPSVERLYKNIDKYLPGHDLDKEILCEPMPIMVSALPNRKLQGHKKSIRNVANEAHRNWRNAVNVIRTNNLIRRRSTKMWHRAVEQVKPGMKASVQKPGELPKSKKLQWLRGGLIGKGSFGRVYHALNVEAGEWIAVKQVDLPTTKADLAKPELREIKDGLFREIALLEDLDNEYIVQYLGYNVDEEEGHINIFLEYVPGGSIASCLSKTGKFDVELVQFFTRQILLGLAYLHNRNILHRDIKAGNILLDQNGICKITDFGLSKLSGQDKAYDPHSNNSVMRGTVFWMAPEVVKGTNYNAKVDIWSLGCTVIEMLTGNHPWLDLNMLAALYNLGKYQAPPIPEDIPKDARDFLTKCFTINPEERPTAEQLLEHDFVQTNPSFEFKKHMKQVQVERRATKK